MKLAPAIKKNVKDKNGECNIKIRISHNGLTRYIGTYLNIHPSFWEKNKVKKKHPNADYLNNEILSKVLSYNKKLLGIDIRNLHVDRLVELLKDEKEIHDFSSYFANFIKDKERINKRTSEIYQATLNKIQKFDKRSPLMFEDITAGWLRKFENSMIEEEMKVNSSSIHFRNIRTIFNNAIDDEIIDLNLYPFRRFKIKPGKPSKEINTIEELKSIRDFQTEDPDTLLARDVFMLSFYMIGTNNSDLYNLEKIHAGRVLFNRAKTHKDYSIKLEPEALNLIERLKGGKIVLLLSERFKSAPDMTKVINAALKNILPELTMYHARRSWATIASNVVKASNEDIASALGHSIKTVTEGYIKRDPGIVDKLNRDVLDCLIEKPKKIRGKKKVV